LRIDGRRAEVDEFDYLVVYDLDIFGRYVFMNNTVLVQEQERFEHRAHYIERFRDVQSAASAVYEAVKAHAVEVFHDDICRIVGKEKVVNADYAVHVFYGREHFCFLNERRKPIIENFAVCGVRHVHRARSGYAFGITFGEEFFYGDALAREHIVRFICNAETAAAERRAYKVTSRKQNASRQRLRGNAVGNVALMAVYANARARIYRSEAVYTY